MNSLKDPFLTSLKWTESEDSRIIKGEGIYKRQKKKKDISYLIWNFLSLIRKRGNKCLEDEMNFSSGSRL